jgi:hypothetical protein
MDVFEFGSAYPLERNLAAYEAGFRYDTYDLTILSVSDIRQTTQLLRNLHMTYVVPKEEYGTVWKIPQEYTEGQIRSALASLPHTFCDQKFYTLRQRLARFVRKTLSFSKSDFYQELVLRLFIIRYNIG